jgi:uncharacterized protein YjbI with pentapeptide repeats
MVDRPPQPADDDSTDAKQHRRAWKRLGDSLLARYKQYRRAWQAVGVGLLALGLLVLLLACVLWIPKWLYPSLADADLQDIRNERNLPDAAKVQEFKDARLKLQNDARTTLLQGLGAVLVLTGAGIGASVTLRQIRETAKANRDQLQLGEQGQVTDRYTRAVEQLGHENAPVRLGALYSLEHLAQDNPEYRQTVVDVFCAYLRMPYPLPPPNVPSAEPVGESAHPANDRDQSAHPVPVQDPAQELQVRQTAQRILTAHLHLPPGTFSPAAQRRPSSSRWTFWPRISLDLTGAALVNVDFARLSVVQARFGGAAFQGGTEFREAAFHDIAMFDGAAFHGGAGFDGAAFHGGAGFDGAAFHGGAGFDGAAFYGDAGFDKAVFHGDARFDKAIFEGRTGFSEVTFHGETRFERAVFHGHAGFNRAIFQGYTTFSGVTFHGGADFEGAAFH